jgi:hypothetical protein
MVPPGLPRLGEGIEIQFLRRGVLEMIGYERVVVVTLDNVEADPWIGSMMPCAAVP